VFSSKYSLRFWINQLAEQSAEPWLWLRGQLRHYLPGWRPRLACMVFHDIAPGQEHRFRRQIEALQLHYTIVDLPEFGRRLRGETAHTEDALLLTFDDAFVSSLRVGAILEEYGLRGLFFVPTDFIECASAAEQRDYVYQHLFYGQFAPGSLSENLRPMSWENLRGLVAAGHHLGCHTRRHCPLQILETEESRREELLASADLIEAKLGCRVESFAMPFGTLEIMTAPALATLTQRYRYVFTSVRGDNQGAPPGALRRETVMADDSPYYVLFQAAGGLSWAYRKAHRQIALMLGPRAAGAGHGDRRA